EPRVEAIPADTTEAVMAKAAPVSHATEATTATVPAAMGHGRGTAKDPDRQGQGQCRQGEFATAPYQRNHGCAPVSLLRSGGRDPRPPEECHRSLPSQEVPRKKWRYPFILDPGGVVSRTGPWDPVHRCESRSGGEIWGAVELDGNG